MNFFKKKQKFEIEFYPISNKYFPKYNDYYLKRYYITLLKMTSYSHSHFNQKKMHSIL